LENYVQKPVDRLWAKYKVIQEGVLPGQRSGDRAAKLSIETESTEAHAASLEAGILE
jgi:hypothetical protein